MELIKGNIYTLSYTDISFTYQYVGIYSNKSNRSIHVFISGESIYNYGMMSIYNSSFLNFKDYLYKSINIATIEK